MGIEFINKSVNIIVSKPTTSTPDLMQPDDHAICELYPQSEIFWPAFSYLDFVKTLQTDFDHFFARSRRRTLFYGNHDYSYGRVNHKSRPISDNSYVSKFFNILTKLFPQYQFNSILINFYPDFDSHLPYHADNEPEIGNDSSIITLSLGTSRCISFRCSSSKEQLIKLILKHGDILTFSRKSQSFYEHSILSSSSISDSDILTDENNSIFNSSRISLTFRNLE